MAPARRKRGAAAVAAAAAAAAQWKVGDLVLAKMKGFPAWPAMISEPEQWGLSSVKKKLLVYFYGTKQIAFCNYADLEAFTEEKKKALLVKRQGKGADFVRAVDEIIDIYESLKKEDNNKRNSDGDVKPDVDNLANNTSSLDGEAHENSPNLGNGHRLDGPSVTSSLVDDMVSSHEPSITIMESERCIVNSAPDEPIEKVSILDELKHTPLSTSSFSRKKRQRDTQPQNCYARNRFPSLQRSRSSLSVEPRKIQDYGKLLNDNSLVSVDSIPDDQQEESAQRKCTGDGSPNSEFPAATDNVWLHPSGGTCNQPGTSGVSNDNKLSFANIQGTCNSEVCQTGALEKEVKLNGMSDPPTTATVIFKRKRQANRKRANCSTDCVTPSKDEELQVEVSGSLADSPNSRNELNKADGDGHLPLVKRARVRMGQPLVEDSLVDEPDVPNNRTELATCADHHVKDGMPIMSEKDHSAHETPPGLRDVSNPSPKVDLSVLTGGHPVWKNMECQPKVSTLDVEAALPPSKRLHRALEAMSANAAEIISNTPEVSGSKEFIPRGCTTSVASSLCNKSTAELIISPNRSAIIKSPKVNTHSLDSPEVKRHTSEPIIPNNIVPVSIYSEVEIDHSHIPPKDKVSEETNIDTKNKDCSFACEVKNDVPEKACNHIIKLNEPTYDVPHTVSVPDQLLSSLGKTSENEVTKPTNCAACDVDKNVDGSAGLVNQRKVVDLDTNGICDSIPHGEAVLVESTVNVGDTMSTSSLATKSSSIQSDAGTRTFEMHTFSTLALKELNHKRKPKEKSISPDSMPMKELIAVAQARRFSRSTSFADNFVDSKFIPEALVNTSPLLKEGSDKQSSPSKYMIRSAFTTDRACILQNSGRTSFDTMQQKSLNELAGHDEANAAKKAFDAFLGTLTRTKESIARATRLAMECAKHGIAGEVIDIILEHLEKQSNLYKRVDLFFLVDSITQCSRNQKGGVGDVYPSLIQAVLPRLLYAAAPPGNSAWENRRQCLKVLKLWLERKTLPDYIIRHHIRELEVLNEASFGSSRRPLRTERALNDPLRENEGMLVDEYGSNAGFHLPSLICTKVLEDEEGSFSEERSFEAVTPEHEAPSSDGKEASQRPTEKHRHILEEVDGELEMEDVAPSSEFEVSSASQPARASTATDQHLSKSIPPLPDDRPPSPPPLPSSPPPMPPPPMTPPTTVAQDSQVQATSHTAAGPIEPHPPIATCNVQTQQPHCVAEHPGNINPCIAPSHPPPFYNSGYAGHPNQLPPPPPVAPLNASGPHGNFSAPPAPHYGNNYHQPSNAPVPNKAYHLQPPPPPPVSNQFPYVPHEPQQRPQPWDNNCSSYPERYPYNGHERGHHGHDRGYHFDDRECHFEDRGHHFDDRGHHFDDRDIRGPMHHEIVDRGRYHPFPPGPPIPDHFEASPLHYGQPSDPPPGPCPGWSMPPRISNYPPASRRSMEPPVSHVGGGWRRHERHNYNKYRR